MKTFIATVVMAMLISVGAQAAELDWGTDYKAALEKAKKENKLVLMDFTGSDWCGWCIKLKKEVFSTPEFAEYAKKNLVLLEVDFPMRKPQPEALKKANQALGEKYKIEGYPTLVILDSNGKQVSTMGYEPGGPKPFVQKLDALKK